MKDILKEIERNYKSETEKGKIGMILSNFIDVGNSKGGLISVKQFDELSDTIIEFYKLKIHD